MLSAFSARACCTQIDIFPELIPQVHDDWFRSAADYNPLEGDVVRRVDLLVRKPCRDEKEIATPRRCIELSPVAPANIGSPAQDIRNRVLLSVMVNSRMGS